MQKIHIIATQYKGEGKLDGLIQAIDNMTPMFSSDREAYISSLIFPLNTRSEKDGKLDDVNRVIEHSQDAVNLTSEGNPNRAGCLSNPSHCLSTRYEREAKLDDLKREIVLGQNAFNLTGKENFNRA